MAGLEVISCGKVLRLH